MIKILAPSTPNPKTQIKLPGDLFYHSFFIDYVDYSWQYWPRRKPVNEKKLGKRAVNKIVSHGHKTQQQKRLTQQGHILDHTRFYGVMVSNLDAESNDSSLNFVERFSNTFCSVM